MIQVVLLVALMSAAVVVSILVLGVSIRALRQARRDDLKSERDHAEMQALLRKEGAR